ncbi:hypothetical protein BHE74_00025149 [Ensete ventricosum]|uniref:Uncharacterized protein n=1 Tax=Ensete ventricosum TaxID=4639 RepID=A0A426ZXI8_ENSVE|nr:hypothetical protein B296_00038102 [Ensete ventricosum]RWW67409.1 hypothetical protein BHE74_00025149 [Ensete ventricosum]
MVRVATYFALSFGAFLFWQSMAKAHVWMALHHDEKVSPFPFLFLSRFIVVGSVIEKLMWGMVTKTLGLDSINMICRGMDGAPNISCPICSYLDPVLLFRYFQQDRARRNFVLLCLANLHGFLLKSQFD